MLKNISSLGKPLNKEEQKSILGNGRFVVYCRRRSDCATRFEPFAWYCINNRCIPA